MLLVKVNGQRATKLNDEKLVAGAVNFVQISFEFDSSWEGLNKTYQFSSYAENIDVISNETILDIPQEVLVEGTLSVKVFAEKLDENGTVVETKATVNPVYYNVISSGIVEPADNTAPVTPTDKEQIRQIAEDSKTLSDNTFQTVTEIKGQTDALLAVKGDVEQLKNETVTAELNAKTSETNAKQSETNAANSESTTAQTMSDLLAMMGTDVATLTGGKLTPSQIPAIAVTDTFVVASEAEMLALVAETGDVCIRTDESKTYILQGADPTILTNWKQLQTPTNYADESGHAATADEATNASTINGHRIVYMTQSQYDVAVKDPETVYMVGVE